MQKRIIPPRLAPGAMLALIAPASSPTEEELAMAVSDLQRAGYRVKTYRNLTRNMGYLSGTDEQRAEELMDAFADPEVDGILAARGGYGVTRLLDQLDYEAIRAHPKVLTGYSDLTALHVAIDKFAGLTTYHAPNAIDGLAGGGKLDAASIDSFWAATSDSKVDPADHGELNSLRALVGGVGEGRLIGGNLAVFCGLVGTRFDPDTRGRILFLEDIGERPYRIDRMFSQLQLAGKLSELSGVLLGHFTDCDETGDKPSLAIHDVLKRYLGDLGAPVLVGYPAGHALPNLTLPHGGLIRINADRREVTQLE